LEVFRRKEIIIEKEVSATKETISDEGIWDLVKKGERIVVASGKKIIEFTPNDDKNDILAKIAGRTGNLRAPTVKVGSTFYIGFNEELYNDRIG
jgi:hypothetical protein